MHEGTAQLIDQLETEARERAVGLETTGKLPAGFTDRHYPLTRREKVSLQRLAIAWRMAGDLDALHDLLLGVPIDPSRVKKAALEEALTASLVQLVRPIDILHGRAA